MSWKKMLKDPDYVDIMRGEDPKIILKKSYLGFMVRDAVKQAVTEVTISHCPDRDMTVSCENCIETIDKFMNKWDKNNEV